MLLCLLATAQAATPTRTTVAKPQLLPAEAWDRIRTGRVHVERDFIDATLAQRLRAFLHAPPSTRGGGGGGGSGSGGALPSMSVHASLAYYEGLAARLAREAQGEEVADGEAAEPDGVVAHVLLEATGVIEFESNDNE